MECPYCHKSLTDVTNSRPTRHASQIWRRRKCTNCGETFTTHEIIDLSHLIVLKKSGKSEMYSRMKLYSGVYSAISSRLPNRQKLVEKVTQEVERQVLSFKNKRINSQEIADLVLKSLKKTSTPSFLKFLAYCKDIKNESQMLEELNKYN